MSVSTLKLHQLRLNRLSEKEAADVIVELERTGQMERLAEVLAEDEAFLARFPETIGADRIQEKLRRARRVEVQKTPRVGFQPVWLLSVALFAITVAFGSYWIVATDTVADVVIAPTAVAESTPKESDRIDEPKLVPSVSDSKRFIFITNEVRAIPIGGNAKRITIGMPKVMAVSTFGKSFVGEAGSVGSTEITVLSFEDVITEYFITVGKQFGGDFVDPLPADSKNRLTTCERYKLPRTVRIYFDRSGLIYDVELTKNDDAHKCVRKALRGSRMRDVATDENGFYADDLLIVRPVDEK